MRRSGRAGGARRSQAREGLESSVALVALVAFGLGWAAVESRARQPGAAYPDPMREEPRPGAAAAPRVWLLDGFNVLHAGILGGRDRSEWWTRERREELLERASHFDDAGAEIWVAFDGPRPEPDPQPARRVRPVFAPSADEWLLRRVRESGDPSQLAVVTADRSLAGRARHRGACVVSPQGFLARCGVEPAVP